MNRRRRRWMPLLGILCYGCGADSPPAVSAITDASGSGGGTLTDRLDTDAEKETSTSTADSIVDLLDVAASDAVEVGAVDGGANSSDSGMVAVPPLLTWKNEFPNRAFRGIWGSGPDDIYAVADLGTIEHFTGGKWVNETAGTSEILYGVWGSGPGDVYIAVYSNVVLHSTGDGKWEHQGLPVGSTFRGIWGSGPNDIYVYQGGYIHGTGGGNWSTGVNLPEQILHMWGSSATDVYAAGNIAHVYHSKGEGTGWMAQAPGGSRFVGVGGSSATDVYAITGLELFHSRGDGNWQPQAIPLRVDVDGLVSIWAVGPNAVYAGTSEGMLLRTGGDGRWVGEIVDPPGTSNAIHGIWGTSPTNLYLAASGGIYHGTL